MAGFMTRNILACVVPTILAFISVYWFRKRRKIKQNQSQSAATNNLGHSNSISLKGEIKNADKSFDISFNSISNSSSMDNAHVAGDAKSSFNLLDSETEQMSDSCASKASAEEENSVHEENILLAQELVPNSSVRDDKHLVNDATKCSFNSSDSNVNQLSENDGDVDNGETAEEILLPHNNSNSDEFSAENKNVNEKAIHGSMVIEKIPMNEKSLDNNLNDCSSDEQIDSSNDLGYQSPGVSINGYIPQDEEIVSDETHVAHEWHALNDLVTKTVFAGNAELEPINVIADNTCENHICPVESSKTSTFEIIFADKKGECDLADSAFSRSVDDSNIKHTLDSFDANANKEEDCFVDDQDGEVLSECDVSSSVDTSTLSPNELSSLCMEVLAEKEPMSPKKSISAYDVNQHQEVNSNSEETFSLEPLLRILNESDCVDNQASTEKEVVSSTFSQSASIEIPVQELVPDTRDSILRQPPGSNLVGILNCRESDSSVSPPHSDPSVNLSDVPSEDSSDSGKGSELHAVNLKTFEADSNHCVFEFELPQELCGRLIGKHGKHVKFIKERSNANVYIKRHPYNPQAKLAVVEGSHADVNNALELIRKKYPPSQFPNVSLAQINVGTSLGVPLPESLQLHLPEGSNCDVILSSLVNAGHFFLQQPTHPTYPSLSTLDQCMLTCYAQVETPQLPQPIEAGVICAAAIMSGWYRAQVVYAYDNEECLVRFVDYGGYSQVPSSSLRQIRSDFMTLPFQATESYLANVQPINEESGWTAESYGTFEELAQGQILQAVIVDYSDDGTPFVHLFRVQGISSTFINQELVNRGVAKWVELH